jgi:hypothetical protein
MTFFDYSSGMCNCLFSFIIYATLGSLCHAKTFCILPILARMNVLQNIYFCGTQKSMWHFKYFASTYIIQNICEIITLQHEVPESQKCYVGQPQLPCTSIFYFEFYTGWFKINHLFDEQFLRTCPLIKYPIFSEK